MAFKCFPKTIFTLSLCRRRPRPSTASPPISTSSEQESRKADPLQESFRYLDGDGDGKISSEELRLFLVSMGEDMSQEEAKVAINYLDSDGDDLLNFQDFVHLMEKGGGGDRHDYDLRWVFEMFEFDKGSGRITPDGLQLMLNRLGDERTHEDCQAMIHAYDRDGDGSLDFHEFQLMMT